MKQLFGKLSSKFSKERFSVGLNIGVSTVKMVKVRFVKDFPEVCAFAIAPAALDIDEVIKAMVKAHSLKNVNISVSGQQAISRYIDFPAMNQSELKQALRFEAQKYIPFPVSEVNIDGCILREGLADNKMRVLLAAVKKDFLNQRMKLLQDLGLEVDIVDVDSLALINAFTYNYAEEEHLKEKTIALLNIGSATSNLNILEMGVPSLSRDIAIGGNHFTQRVADALGVDFKTAEGLKVSAPQDKTEKIQTAVESVLAKLSQEIRTSFDYYESRSVSSVEKIFLSGGGSLYSNVQDTIQNLLGLEVLNWDALKKVSIGSGLDAVRIRSLSGQLAVALGLALRNV